MKILCNLASTQNLFHFKIHRNVSESLSAHFYETTFTYLYITQSYKHKSKAAFSSSKHQHFLRRSLSYI